MKNLTRTEVENMPKEIREEVLEMLTAYDECDIWFEDGKYNTITVLKANYSKDHKYIGHVEANDIYTETEQIENYINNFISFPTNYKGEKNYTELNIMETERKKGNTKIGKINKDGNFKLIK